MVSSNTVASASAAAAQLKVKTRDEEITELHSKFQETYEHVDVGLAERELTQRLQQLNQKLTAAVSQPSPSSSMSASRISHSS